MEKENNQEENRIESLERRLAELEMTLKNRNPHICPPCPFPHYPQPVTAHTNPNLHWHNSTPCYQNPCYWC